MPRLAVLGHPVAHSRSPAMHNAALAELGLGDEWSYEAIDVAPDDFEPRVRAMPGEGFAGANVTVPHKGAALALADDALGDRARDRRRQHAELRRRRDPRRQHRRRRPARARCRSRRRARGRWCSAPGGAARAVVWALRPRGRRGRGLEPHRAARRAPLRGARRARRSTAPDQARLRADRQLDRGRPARRGPVRRAAARAATASPPARPSSTWSTASGRAALLRGRRGGRGDRRRRHRDPRPAGRPLAAKSGPGASRRSTSCAPPPRAA